MARLGWESGSNPDDSGSSICKLQYRNVLNMPNQFTHGNLIFHTIHSSLGSNITKGKDKDCSLLRLYRTRFNICMVYG